MSIEYASVSMATECTIQRRRSNVQLWWTSTYQTLIRTTIAGLLGDVDDLDAGLFGTKSVSAAKKVSFSNQTTAAATTATPGARPKSGLGNLDSLFGDKPKETKKAKTFDDLFPSASAESKPTPAPSFSPEKKSGGGPASGTAAKPKATLGGGFDDLFGPTTKRIADSTPPAKGANVAGAITSNQPSRQPESVTPAQPRPNTAEAPVPTPAKMDDLFGPAPRRATSASKPSATSWLGISSGGGRGGQSSESEEDDFKSLIAKKKQGSPQKDAPPPKSKVEAEPTQKAKPAEALSFLSGEPSTTTTTKPATMPPAQTPINLSGSMASTAIQSNVSSHYDEIVTRLQRDVDRLSNELNELKEKKRADEEVIVQEWKDKLGVAHFEAEKELNRLKELHKRTLEEMEQDRALAVERVKSSMSKELEAAASAYEHTRNYHDVMNKVETAVDQLTHLSTNVSGLNERTTQDREMVLNVREERVRNMETRFQKELEDLALEKEKVHAILLRLDVSSREQEKMLEHDKWQVRQEQTKLDATKASFREEQRAIADATDRQRRQLDEARETFLGEQHDLLARILREQETIQQEKAAFMVQRDRDVIRLRKEASNLEEKLRQVDRAEDLLERSRIDYERKQQRLIELEQTLMDECAEMERTREELERQRLLARQNIDELRDKQAEIARLNLEALAASDSRRHAWDDQREGSIRQREYLREQELELRRQKELFFDERRRFDEERLSIVCPECGHRLRDRVNVDQQTVKAERPYDSPTSEFVRSGSIRSVLKHHAKLLEKFIDDDRK